MHPLSSLQHVSTMLRRLARTAILPAALVLVAASAQAQTVYVDGSNPAASDLNIGTELQPFKTINGAMGPNKGAAVTILVKPGVYREQVSLPTSGALGFPFVFRATAPGVIIDGSDDFSTAVQWGATAGGEFLAASVNWTTTQVLIDGVRLTPSTAAPGSLPANSFRYVAGQGLYVDFNGINPGTHLVQVSHRSFGFTMSTKSFVTIDGFEITRTQDRGINIFGSNDLVIANNKVTFANSYGIQAVGSQNLVIEGNLVTDSNFHGIGLTAGGTGGTIPTTGCIVRNNECARNAHPTIRQANGIFVSGSSSNTMYNNRLHHNQDTGMHFALASNNCLSYNNLSYANGDHGYDHLQSTNTIHVHDVAFGNFIDGFSFEGDSPGGQVFNCISVDNGLTQNGSDLWVDTNSSVGFASNNNLLWNSTPQPPAKMGLIAYALLSDFTLATGRDANSRQANPLFVNAANGDFHLSAASPAIDAATSNAPSWPALDASGGVRLDDASILDGGSGPVTFADMGAFEFVPPADRAPVVVSPAKVIIARGGFVTFTVTASDPDGDPITSLTMSYAKLPKNAAPPTFVVSADKTSGTFTWQTPNANGTSNFTFTARNAMTGTSITGVQLKKTVRAPFGPVAAQGEFFDEVALSAGFPMPSAGAVDFALTLPSDENVDWGIYDAQGRRVWSETLSANAGYVRLRWSGVDMSGRRAATGIYFARVRVGETEFVRRVVRF